MVFENFRLLKNVIGKIFKKKNVFRTFFHFFFFYHISSPSCPILSFWGGLLRRARHFKLKKPWFLRIFWRAPHIYISLSDLRWARNPTKYETFFLVLTFGRVRMLKTLWKAHKSKDWMFLLRNYIQLFFSTPKKYVFSH